MASSGKKGKKPKGTVISLQTFLSNGDKPPLGLTQVAKNIRNISGDDSDDGDNMLTLVCQLPTAPRANREFDENPIPYKPPFIAYVTNLPFDVNEEDICAFFNNNNIVSVRLPRDDGEHGRVRGFGYVEFETRDDLIHALGLTDPSIKGRRIRIELSNETEQNSRQRGNRRNYEASSNSENRESTNWRRDNLKKDVNKEEFDRSDKKYTHPEDTLGSWRSRNRCYDSAVKCGGKDFDNIQFENNADAILARPKLNLKPRTLPLPDLDIASSRSDMISNDEMSLVTSIKNTGVSAEKVFGAAKPVDTTARDLEIEQRLSDSRKQDSLRKDIDTSKTNIQQQTTTKEPLLEFNWRKPHNNEDSKKKNRSEIRPETVWDNRNTNQEESARSNNLNRLSEDESQKGISKGKRDKKTGRPLPKYSHKQDETVLVSSNMYSGLDDVSE